MNLHPQQSRRGRRKPGESGVYFITLQQINGDNHLSDGDRLPSQGWTQPPTHTRTHTHNEEQYRGEDEGFSQFLLLMLLLPIDKTM